MLTSLRIENVAVIEKVQVQFTAGLNVLTGETGAGKSILIDSISAILGNRISRDLVRTGAPKACIWATFDQLPKQVKMQLEQAGYDAGEELLIYREITAEGKSHCRINGMPATVSVLRDITAGLINIHGQHDSQGLTDPSKHLGILDAFAQNQNEFNAYRKVYKELIAVKRQADALQLDEAEKQRRMELLRFQLNEIEDAALQIGEEERLIARRQIVSHAQTILEQIASAHSALSGGDEFSGAADLLGGANGALEQAAVLDESLQPLQERLADLYYSARELAVDLASRLDDYGFDPAELDQLEQRLDTIYRLKNKYGADSVEELLHMAEKSREELEHIERADETLEQLNQQKQALYKEAKLLAEKLTQTRLNAFERMEQQLVEACTFLNMPGTRFVLQHSRGPLASSGQDTVEFYISTNLGEAPKPLAKIASGGELSRIMLALKSALAEKDAIPTVIYDEIDTGVSGLAAGRIGEKLRQTSKGRQVLCITHTAQIAALATSHLLIQKNVEGQRTFTQIHPLDQAGRVQELARIISGDHITDLSLANAREMLSL
ncbi:DNA repair protein RecN [Gemmiger sp. An50]|uniref:DNA repair protein RecN n=1 Tax=Gemmiger sp. An50 TaxID=1965639 RepID=UPI000B3A8317|nr:DNA repair protein RecN [Gemmiger sp. An50]OUN85724.1 DNA repair protein RecN [Gemmiger sp. An50]